MPGTLAGFEVRPATPHDVSRIAELDRRAFAGLGMGCYGESYVRCWLEVNSEGLLVAWQGDTAVACCYSQYVDFSPGDVALLTTDAEFTDSALTRKTHRPNGNSIQVVTVSSVVPGGRRALFEALNRQLVAQGREYLILFSRVAGFEGYCRMLEGKGLLPPADAASVEVSGDARRDVRAPALEQIARWYVVQCARLYGGGVWPEVDCEDLALPPPVAPDPVLSKYLKDPGACVAAVLADWIEDPASRNFSVLVAIANSRAGVSERIFPGNISMLQRA
jgi:hypothetical protein